MLAKDSKSQLFYMGVVWFTPMPEGVNLTLMLYPPDGNGRLGPSLPVADLLAEDTIAQVLWEAGLVVHSSHSSFRFVGAVIFGANAHTPERAVQALQAWANRTLTPQGIAISWWARPSGV